MYYAAAGQQQQQQNQSQAQTQRGMSMGPAGYAPMSATIARGGPPGFGSRSDHNDFPALSTSLHPSHSTYQPQLNNQTSSLAPPPPPGLTGPTTPQQQGSSGANGMEREEFPALGGEKDRMNYLRAQQATSPSIPNGSSHTPNSQPAGPPGVSIPPGSGSAQPSNMAQHQNQGQDQYARHSPIAQPINRQPEQVVRPVQQILTSPVDKWGLKALLYEITTQMGKTDRGVLMFGEELAEMGLDVAPEDPLYPTFTTPWQDNAHIQPSRIQEMYSTPPQYQFNPTQMSSKVGQMSEETLIIAFYSSPQDLVQLEAAAELFARGWRYHMEHQIWLNGPSINQYEPPSPSHSPSLSHAGSTSASGGNGGGAGGATTNQHQPPTQWLLGPFLFYDPRTFLRDRMPEDAGVNAAQLEWSVQAPRGDGSPKGIGR